MYRNHPVTQVLPHLYLGGSKYDIEDLKKRQIKHVLTVCYDPKVLEEHDESYPVNMLHLSVDDFPDDIIRNQFAKAFAFIEQAQMKKESILVHCHAGMSRSPAITIAYLLHAAKYHRQELLEALNEQDTTAVKEQDIMSVKYEEQQQQHIAINIANEPSLRNAFGFVKSKRQIIEPNNGFMKQLIQFEKELFGEISADPTWFDDMVWGEGCTKLFEAYLQQCYSQTSENWDSNSNSTPNQ